MAELNKYILMAMNHENHTQEELKANAEHAEHTANAATAAAVHTAAADSSASDSYADDCIEYWLNVYFKATGESREDYESELKRSNGEK